MSFGFFLVLAIIFGVLNGIVCMQPRHIHRDYSSKNLFSFLFFDRY